MENVSGGLSLHSIHHINAGISFPDRLMGLLLDYFIDPVGLIEVRNHFKYSHNKQKSKGN